MMRITYAATFYNDFRVLSFSDREAVKETIRLFEDNPNHPILKNHPLRKPLYGQRAISVHDDLRITFRERGNYIEVLMLDVGDHDRVYGK